MATPPPYHLFQVFGVELEYMIVDIDTLSVRPVTDQLIRSLAGEFTSEVDVGTLAWSNELALHVVELKTNGPVDSLEPLADLFQSHVGRIHEILQPLHARLMPTGMHPWMDPDRELQLWPHEYNPVYEAYHRIFDCRGHGWANLQSVHLNLPFANDEEFGRLHAAIRLLLPLLPALAASSPVADGRITGWQDHRLEVYRGNALRVPSVTGDVIPEPVYTQQAYCDEILQRMYDDIRPLDPGAILQHEWLNSRGAIARFDRNAIEIRVLDVQECPRADLAICAAVRDVLQGLVAEQRSSTASQQRLASDVLVRQLHETIRHADQAVVDDHDYLQCLGMPPGSYRASDVWRQLLSASGDPDNPLRQPLQLILDQGPLSRRIVRALGTGSSDRMRQVYRQLCDCLKTGELFSAHDESTPTHQSGAPSRSLIH